MGSNRETTSQTTCDCEDCPSYAITAHIKLTTPAEQAAQHRRGLATDGWSDHEGRNYCPGCPPNQQTESHDHEGAWAVEPEDAP